MYHFVSGMIVPLNVVVVGYQMVESQSLATAFEIVFALARKVLDENIVDQKSTDEAILTLRPDYKCV